MSRIVENLLFRPSAAERFHLETTPMLTGKSILITGATGSFGNECCRHILKKYKPERLIVFSRDELKQSDMASHPDFAGSKSIRFFLGDVRDRNRLERAMTDVDYVIHAAALKQVPAAEYNPHEFIKTNINGAMHVVDAAIAAKVKRVIALSTDKAVNPINLYGATKLCSDKIFIAGNSYSGKTGTRFSVVRYGNVIGSRGSVIPLFQKQKKTGTVTVTDPDMTRFFLTVDAGVKFALRSLKDMHGGEIFVPKLKSCVLKQLVEVIAPGCKIENIGLRPGEKMHEALIPEDEATHTREQASRYIIEPAQTFWGYDKHSHKGKFCKKGFNYDSATNPEFLTNEEIKKLCAAYLD